MTYGTVAAFVDYHEARGREIPGTWDDTVIAAALLVASEWIDAVYGPSFTGYKTAGFTQEREWPRAGTLVRSTGYWGDYYAYPDTEVPDRVEYATYEAAWREATTPQSLDIDYTPGKYKSVTIEGALSVDYREVNAPDLMIQISKVDNWLWPLLDNGSGASLSSLSGGSTRV